MLKEFVRQFTNEDIIGDFVKINREYFSVPANLEKISLSIKTRPEFAGIPLGREKGKIFAPSLYLLQKLIAISGKKIQVDNKGEWMFICGKDVFGKSVTKSSNEQKTDDLVLVENQYCECLGYGKIVAELTQKGVVVKNIFDIGDFLRRQR